ncbi:hypothetical protein BSIN_3393 [Burkholderia singularis]|uniref:Uncharacterized protein n=1 Tax=Burkholderia singularis TaxID=1503053 RepID=A0A238H5M5_9BURK|nr:hypothetical protein BSIN_3393 [Burkholderia singularis]
MKNLPAAYTVEIDGKEYPGTSPTCDLTFEHAGTYDVTVKAFPMLDAIFTLTI